jgi:N-acetylglucosaminyldiphosphoundecaprenol N-acetyl-beta-D-mannosaminyltransferase
MCQLLSIIATQLQKPAQATDQPLLIMTPNPEQVVLTRTDPVFLTHLQQSDLLMPDGIGLVWASKLLSLRTDKVALQERIAGREVVVELLRRAAEHDWSVLVIGGRELGSQGILLPVHLDDSLPAYSSRRWFWLEGYQAAAKPTAREESAVITAITRLHPQIVFVALGAPHQESWLITHRQLLSDSGVKIAMAVGGSFDVLTGRLRSAPTWVTAIHLEWLFRLSQEPHRWRRQLRLVRFCILTVRELLWPS